MPGSVETHSTGIIHATPLRSQRLLPIAFDIQCVASVAASRETKMPGSVENYMMDDC
jgi:hypothetical protein